MSMYMSIPWADSDRYACLICKKRACSYEFFDTNGTRIATSCDLCFGAVSRRVRDKITQPFPRAYETILSLDT